MKIKRLITAFAAATTTIMSMLASPAFIQHRQDAFKAVPTSKGQIIFLGNSITNFHCWADAFVRPDGLPADEDLISNRGISDERAYHWKHNVQMMLDGEDKPAKIFIGIGTNDLNVGLPPEVVANDIRAIIRQIQVSSPSTEIHLQSILPRGGAINDVVMRTIPLLEAMAGEMGVDFINLTETMNGLGALGNWTVDNLHPNGVGYRAWVKQIAPKVGLECAYVDGNNNYAGFGSVAGVHASQYGLMPVNEDEILMIGDAWVDAVQWHEFLGNAKVKNRSIGSGALTKANIKTLIDRTLKANSSQKCPKGIVICWGNSTAKADYEEVIAYAQAAAPNAKILLCQTPPTNDNGHNANLVINQVTSVPVVDLEAKGMTQATAGQWNMSGGIGGRGCLYAAQAVAEALNKEFGAGTAKIPSTDDFEARYANRNRRIEVAKCFNALYQYRLEANKDVTDAIAKIEEILKGNTVTEAQVTEARTIRDEALKDLQFSIDTEKWYHISSPRNYEAANASVASISHSGSNPFLVDKKLSATESDGSDIWAFRQRPDGTYDIMSFDGFYLIPGNTISASRIYPSEGWTLEGGSAETGTYIISCGDVHLHRDGSNNLINYWKKGDTGCDFYISEFPGELPETGERISDGWITIRIDGGYNVANLGVAGKSVINHPTGIKRSNGFYEMTMADADEQHPANAFFHLTTNDNGTWTINGLTGHAYMENSVSTRVTTDKTLGINRIDATTYNIGYWTPFSEAGTPMMGKSGDNRAIFTVEPADVSAYDIWKVNIFATEINRNETTNEISEIINDTHVTFNNPANKGLATVYNGGYFFLEPGTEFTADDLTIVCPNLANQSQDHPDVVIDPTSKTIYIDYTEGLPNGWYTFELHSVEGSNATAKKWFQDAVNQGITTLTNAEGIYKQITSKGSNFYSMGYEPEPESGVARQYFYLSTTGDNTYSIRNLHGYYVATSGINSLTPVDVSLPPHATAADVYKSSFMVWEHNLEDADMTYLSGMFSNNYTYYTVMPAEIDPFDVYEVHMIEGFQGAEMPGDAAVTFNSDDNHGIQTVRNNGTFFVTKGVELKPEMFTATTLEGQPAPHISFEPGIITVDYTPVVLESIELDRESEELEVGQTLQLTATAKPDDAANKTIFWSSSDEEVATVDENGLVTAVGAGSATISAFQGEIAATCEITVTAEEDPDPVVVGADKVTIDFTEKTLEEGESVTLTVTVTPENTTDKTVVWTTSDAQVATVDENGVVTAVGEGSATITATCGEVSATCQVTVNKPVPPVVNADKVTIDFTEKTLEEGESVTLTVTFTPENTTDKTVVWTTSDPEVATVDENGVVTAVGEGSATITATCGEVSATCQVTVNKPEPIEPPVPPVVNAESVTLSDEAITLEEGDTATLTATVSPDDTTDKTIEWSSSNPLVASVSAEGVVTALTAGTASITATCGDASASCLVTVTAKIEDSINAINANDANRKVYDLQGRRVKNPSNGVYIQNGKKVVVNKK